MSEEQFRLYSLIINIILALATFSAVFVALWQTKYNNRKKIKLNFTDDMKIASTMSNEFLNYVALQVINIGNRKVIIQNWGISLKNKHYLLFMPEIINDPILKQINTKTPVEINIENSVNFCFPLESFRKILKDHLDKGLFNEKEHLVFKVNDSVGKTYTLKINKTVKELIG